MDLFRILLVAVVVAEPPPQVAGAAEDDHEHDAGNHEDRVGEGVDGARIGAQRRERVEFGIGRATDKPQEGAQECRRAPGPADEPQETVH